MLLSSNFLDAVSVDRVKRAQRSFSFLSVWSGYYRALSNYNSIFVRTFDLIIPRNTCTQMICRQAGKWQNCQKHISVLFSLPGHNERLKETAQRSIKHTHMPTLLPLSRQPSATSPSLLPSPHPLFLSHIYVVIIYALPPPSACHDRQGF